jgi:hypothetical protein
MLHTYTSRAGPRRRPASKRFGDPERDDPAPQASTAHHRLTGERVREEPPPYRAREAV